MTDAQLALASDRNPARLFKTLADYDPAGRRDITCGAEWFSLDIASSAFSAVIEAPSMTPQDFARAVAEVGTCFEKLGRPWCWRVGPASAQEALVRLLEGHGFQLDFEIPCMAMRLGRDPIGMPDEIIEVQTEAEMEEWCTMTEVFEVPASLAVPIRLAKPHEPIRCFMVRHEGHPVAYANTYYSDGVAGVFCVATHKDFRRQGLGEVVTRACLAAAHQDGYREAVLHSSSLGFPLYERMGFKVVGKIARYLPPGGS